MLKIVRTLLTLLVWIAFAGVAWGLLICSAWWIGHHL